MKKCIGTIVALVSLICVISISMTACKQRKIDPKTVIDRSNKPFETVASVVYDDNEFEMRIVRLNDNLYEMEVINPETVSGMTFVYDSGAMKVKYKGMAFTIEADKFPANMIAKSIVHSIDSAFVAEEVSITQDEEGYIIEGKNGIGAFAVKVDPENGNMKSIDIPMEKLKIKFDNFLFLPPTAVTEGAA